MDDSLNETQFNTIGALTKGAIFGGISAMTGASVPMSLLSAITASGILTEYGKPQTGNSTVAALNQYSKNAEKQSSSNQMIDYTAKFSDTINVLKGMNKTFMAMIDRLESNNALLEKIVGIQIGTEPINFDATARRNNRLALTMSRTAMGRITLSLMSNSIAGSYTKQQELAHKAIDAGLINEKEYLKSKIMDEIGKRFTSLENFTKQYSANLEYMNEEILQQKGVFTKETNMSITKIIPLRLQAIGNLINKSNEHLENIHNVLEAHYQMDMMYKEEILTELYNTLNTIGGFKLTEKNKEYIFSENGIISSISRKEFERDSNKLTGLADFINKSIDYYNDSIDYYNDSIKNKEGIFEIGNKIGESQKDFFEKTLQFYNRNIELLGSINDRLYTQDMRRFFPVKLTNNGVTGNLTSSTFSWGISLDGALKFIKQVINKDPKTKKRYDYADFNQSQNDQNSESYRREDGFLGFLRRNTNRDNINRRTFIDSSELGAEFKQQRLQTKEMIEAQNKRMVVENDNLKLLNKTAADIYGQQVKFGSFMYKYISNIPNILTRVLNMALKFYFTFTVSKFIFNTIKGLLGITGKAKDGIMGFIERLLTPKDAVKGGISLYDRVMGWIFGKNYKDHTDMANKIEESGILVTIGSFLLDQIKKGLIALWDSGAIMTALKYYVLAKGAFQILTGYIPKLISGILTLAGRKLIGVGLSLSSNTWGSILFGGGFVTFISALFGKLSTMLGFVFKYGNMITFFIMAFKHMFDNWFSTLDKNIQEQFEQLNFGEKVIYTIRFMFTNIWEWLGGAKAAEIIDDFMSGGWRSFGLKIWNLLIDWISENWDTLLYIVGGSILGSFAAGSPILGALAGGGAYWLYDAFFGENKINTFLDKNLNATDRLKKITRDTDVEKMKQNSTFKDMLIGVNRISDTLQETKKYVADVIENTGNIKDSVSNLWKSFKKKFFDVLKPTSMGSFLGGIRNFFNNIANTIAPDIMKEYYKKEKEEGNVNIQTLLQAANLQEKYKDSFANGALINSKEEFDQFLIDVQNARGNKTVNLILKEKFNVNEKDSFGTLGFELARFNSVQTDYNASLIAQMKQEQKQREEENEKLVSAVQNAGADAASGASTAGNTIKNAITNELPDIFKEKLDNSESVLGIKKNTFQNLFNVLVGDTTSGSGLLYQIGNSIWGNASGTNGVNAIQVKLISNDEYNSHMEQAFSDFTQNEKNSAYKLAQISSRRSYLNGQQGLTSNTIIPYSSDKIEQYRSNELNRILQIADKDDRENELSSLNGRIKLMTEGKVGKQVNKIDLMNIQAFDMLKPSFKFDDENYINTGIFDETSKNMYNALDNSPEDKRIFSTYVENNKNDMNKNKNRIISIIKDKIMNMASLYNGDYNFVDNFKSIIHHIYYPVLDEVDLNGIVDDTGLFSRLIYPVISLNQLFNRSKMSFMNEIDNIYSNRHKKFDTRHAFDEFTLIMSKLFPGVKGIIHPNDVFTKLFIYSILNKISFKTLYDLLINKESLPKLYEQMSDLFASIGHQYAINLWEPFEFWFTDDNVWNKSHYTSTFKPTNYFKELFNPVIGYLMLLTGKNGAKNIDTGRTIWESHINNMYKIIGLNDDLLLNKDPLGKRKNIDQPGDPTYLQFTSNNELLNIGDEKHYNKLNLTLKRNLENYAKDYYNKYGRKVILTSGYRSYAEQSYLYNKKMNGQLNAPIAPPSLNNRHLLGLGADISLDSIDPYLLSKNNLMQPDIDDPYHIEMKNGNIHNRFAKINYRNLPKYSFGDPKLSKKLFENAFAFEDASIDDYVDTALFLYGDKINTFKNNDFLDNLNNNITELFNNYTNKSFDLDDADNLALLGLLTAIKKHDNTLSSNELMLFYNAILKIQNDENIKNSNEWINILEHKKLSKYHEILKLYEDTRKLILKKISTNDSLLNNNGYVSTSMLRELKNLPEWSKYIIEASKLTGIDAELLSSLIKVESNGNPLARSKYAYGLTQIIPGTWNGIIKNAISKDPEKYKEFSEWKNKYSEFSTKGTENTRAQILLGAYYLMQLKHGNPDFDWIDVLRAYNAGPGRVKQYKAANINRRDIWKLTKEQKIAAGIPEKHDARQAGNYPGLVMQYYGTHQYVPNDTELNAEILALKDEAIAQTDPNSKGLNKSLLNSPSSQTAIENILIKLSNGKELSKVESQGYLRWWSFIDSQLRSYGYDDETMKQWSLIDKKLKEGMNVFKNNKSEDRFYKLNPVLRYRFLQYAAAFKNAHSHPVTVTSTYRSKEEQTKLYNERQQAMKRGEKVLPAGRRSLHTLGMAIDINSKNSIDDKLLNQYGLYRPMPNTDPVHVELIETQQFKSMNGRYDKIYDVYGGFPEMLEKNILDSNIYDIIKNNPSNSSKSSGRNGWDPLSGFFNETSNVIEFYIELLRKASEKYGNIANNENNGGPILKRMNDKAPFWRNSYNGIFPKSSTSYYNSIFDKSMYQLIDDNTKTISEVNDNNQIGDPIFSNIENIAKSFMSVIPNGNDIMNFNFKKPSVIDSLEKHVNRMKGTIKGKVVPIFKNNELFNSLSEKIFNKEIETLKWASKQNALQFKDVNNDKLEELKDELKDIKVSLVKVFEENKIILESLVNTTGTALKSAISSVGQVVNNVTSVSNNSMNANNSMVNENQSGNNSMAATNFGSMDAFLCF